MPTTLTISTSVSTLSPDLRCLIDAPDTYFRRLLFICALKVFVVPRLDRQ